MMKISPFAPGPGGADEMPDPDRLNAWPLLYHDRDATSVLWPVVDWDDEGFAVRPLINKEGDDWSALFPASGWNTTDKEGWLATAYHFGDNTGLFPVFNFGDEFSYVVPAWWTDDDEHGVFPLYGWCTDFRHIGPVWWAPDGGKAGLFPLYDQTLCEGYRQRKLALGLLAHFRREKDGDGEQWVLPCWYARDRGEKRTRLLFPVFFHYGDGDMNLLLTPLGGRGADASGERCMVNVVGPVYHYHRRKGSTFHAFLWPVFTLSDNCTWRVWPLASYEGERGRKGILDDLAALRMTDSKTRRGASLLGPFGFDFESRKRKDGAPDWKTHVLLLFRFWHSTYDRRDIPRPLGGMWQACVEREGAQWAVVYRERERYKVWRSGVLTAAEMQVLWHWWQLGERAPDRSRERAAEILRNHGADVGDATFKELREALLRFAETNSEEAETVEQGVPILYKYRNSRGDVDWQALFGAVSGKRVGDRSSVHVLRHLYSRERRGDAIRRDFFPFFTWDSGPERARLSFLWRVFNYEREDGRRRGHVMFIPWGG